ncbi:MAG: hypothetical protein JST10_13720 [Bacteroidetes bacterium]|nr:hypothetical protein [Bacteroidota bacterium]MBS1633621.1 hypothetical protein [Bacteroidota bacterium]
MKINGHSALYFSAYPLKAILQSSTGEEEKSPFLKALLSGKTKALGRIRVSPMMNPYKKNEAEAGIEKKEKKEKNVEPTGDEWYKNYE